MKMTRYFFIGDDLDDLERFEDELEHADFVTPQIHLLTLDDTGAAHHHHLHAVTAFMKQDVVHSALVGAGLGLVVAFLVLVVSHLAGWTQTPAGWMPFIFLAIIALGFCTWEGGLRGIDTPNVHFKNFEKALKDGKHVFFVDLDDPGQAERLIDIDKKHPGIVPAGTARGAPHWIVFSQHRIKRFFTQTFP